MKGPLFLTHRNALRNTAPPVTMSDDKRVKRFFKVMMAQYKAFIRLGSEVLMAVVEETDCAVWYFMIVEPGDPDNPNNPYAGGEYLFKLTAPNSAARWFPNYPPKFEFLTPNGVFQPGGSICISIGEFHADDSGGSHSEYGWRPTIGMKGFAREVVNSLVVSLEVGGKIVDPLEGIRIAVLPDAKKQKLARASRAYNRKHYASVVALFEEFAAAHPDYPAVAVWKGSSEGGGSKGGGGSGK